MTFLYTLAIIFGAVMLSFLMLNTRLIFKGEPLKGTCASNSPFLKTELGECKLCGKKPDEECKEPERHEGSDKKSSGDLPSPGTAGV